MWSNLPEELVHRIHTYCHQEQHTALMVELRESTLFWGDLNDAARIHEWRIHAMSWSWRRDNCAAIF